MYAKGGWDRRSNSAFEPDFVHSADPCVNMTEPFTLPFVHLPAVIYTPLRFHEHSPNLSIVYAMQLTALFTVTLLSSIVLGAPSILSNRGGGGCSSVLTTKGYKTCSGSQNGIHVGTPPRRRR